MTRIKDAIRETRGAGAVRQKITDDFRARKTTFRDTDSLPLKNEINCEFEKEESNQRPDLARARICAGPSERRRLGVIH